MSSIRLPRRATTVVTVGLLSVTVLGVSPVAAAGARKPPPPPPPTTLSAIAPRSADALTDAYGVVVHMASGDGVYDDEATVAAKLTDLGVRHVRTGLYIRRPALYDAISELYAAGIRSDLVMGDPEAEATPTQLVGVVADSLPRGAVDSLEGANEWNLSGRRDWARELRDHQTELYRAAKANPATANIDVLAPALGMREGFRELGDLRAIADIGNEHLYTGGAQPSKRLDDMLAQERAVIAGKPIIFSETGMHNAVNSKETHYPTPESVAGVYAPKLLLEHFSRGVMRMYNYELYDETPDPAKATKEDNFGLLHNDGSPKPAFTALKNLLALTADPGPAYTPAPVAYTVAGATADVRQVLLQKRDGRSYLLLWRDVSIYDRKGKVATPVSPVEVTVGLAEPANVGTYRPSSGAARQDIAYGTRSVPVSLTGDVVALEIAAPPAVPGTARAVTAVPGDGSAQVRWQAPASGATPTGYRVEASPGDAVGTTGGDATSTVLTGLRNGTAYTFTVTATGAAGAGPTSAGSDPVTPMAPPPGPPTAVVAAAGDGSAEVRWTAPGSGSAPTGYRVQANPGDASATTDGASTGVVVNGLRNGTPYTFTVTATSPAGSSPASAPSALTVPLRPLRQPGTPTEVTAAPGDGSLRVSWTPSDTGDPSTGYVVTATPGDISLTVDALDSRAVLRGLDNGTAYRVSVRAVNLAGSSPASAPSDPATPVAPPAAPVGAAGNPRNGGVMVYWKATDPAAQLTGYTVVASPGGATVEAPGDATRALVTGLDNGTPYTFSLVAHNPAGDSPVAVTALSTTPVLPPAEPTAVTATPAAGAATVRWSSPGPDSTVGRYTVTAYPGGITMDVPGTETQALLGGLRSDTVYRFTVIARNPAGRSPESDPSGAVRPDAAGSAAAARAAAAGPAARAGTSLVDRLLAWTTLVD